MTRLESLRVGRVLLGAYVAVHFAMLVPYAAELFSREGMLPDAQLSPLLRAFPNVLAWHDSPELVTTFVALGMSSAVALAAGVIPRAAALFAYYVWACLLGRNPLILNPSLPYVGLMLLGFAAMRLDADDVGRRRFWILLWIAMALGYSYSGVTKLTSASWLDGTAIREVLESPLARPGALRTGLSTAPAWLLTAMTYGVLTLETLFAPLALCTRLRPWIWTAMLGMHLGLVVLVQFADLSLGMVVLHALTFDAAWLRRGLRLPARLQWRRFSHSHAVPSGARTPVNTP